MERILIVDDDPAMRKLLKERLDGLYDMAETADPTRALSLAVEFRPKCILLDLLMPRLGGFELCKTLTSLSVTQLIPIMVLSGNPASQYRDFCTNIGAKDYFQKPIDFGRLRVRIAEVVRENPVERRAEARVRLQVMVKLCGIDRFGKRFEELAVTDDVSSSGFRCSCTAPLDTESIVEVQVNGGSARQRAGRAQVAHVMWPSTVAQQYGFRFVEKPAEWLF